MVRLIGRINLVVAQNKNADVGIRFCLSNMIFNVVVAVCYADVGIRKMLDAFVFAAHINFQLREPVQCALLQM